MSQQRDPDHIDLAAEPGKSLTVFEICTFFSQEILKCVEPKPKKNLIMALHCLEAAFGIEYGFLNGAPSIKNFLKLAIQIPEIEAAESFKQKGNDSMASGSFQEALTYYRMAIRLNPENAVYYCNRAAAHYSIGNYLDSVTDCVTATNLDPTYDKAQSLLGLACLSLNPAGEAVLAYGKAVTLDPQNSAYKDNYEIAKQRYEGTISGATNMQGFSQMVNISSATDLFRGIDSVRALTGLMHSEVHKLGGPNLEAVKILAQQIIKQIVKQCDQ